MSAIYEQLLSKINAREVRVAVMGLGYAGLPLAVGFAGAGFDTLGLDPDEVKVSKLNAGTSYVADVSSREVARLVRLRKLHASSNFDLLRECDVVSICVPTPLSKTQDPDLSYVVAAADEVLQHLREGMLVVLQSTTYPGTTEEIMLPRVREKGLQPGRDVFIAFSPERIDPGRTDYVLKNTPRVIGGVTPICTAVACALFRWIADRVVPVKSAAAGEMVKLLENTFRAVNIALVNEFLMMCDRLGLDVWEIIDAAATKPYGYMKFTPGPGVGGHCIPLDPHYLAWKLKLLNYNARFIQLASEINSWMPAYWANKVMDALNRERKPVNGSRVLVLGVSYKKDVDDIRESPALDIIELLRGKGADVRYHDPYVPHLPQFGGGLHCEPDLNAALSAADCVLIVTDHSFYDWLAVHRQAKLIVDTRNTLARVHPG